MTLDLHTQQHSDEHLKEVLVSFLERFGRINPGQEECHRFFTQVSWRTKGPKRFLQLLGVLAHYELEINRGQKLADMGKHQMIEIFSWRVWHDYACVYLKPLRKGHNMSQSAKVNQYNACAYLQDGFDFIAGIDDTEDRNARYATLRTELPYFFNAFLRNSRARASTAFDNSLVELDALIQRVKDQPRMITPMTRLITPMTQDSEFEARNLAFDNTTKMIKDGAVPSLAAPDGDSSLRHEVAGGKETPPIAPTARLRLQCPFCAKRYVKQLAFAQHTCTQRERAAEVKTPDGRRAFELCNFNQRKLGRAALSEATFMKTHHYVSWLRFARWSREVGIPDVKSYVAAMQALRMSVNVWTHSDCYSGFLRYYDGVAPMQLIDDSVANLQQQAADLGVSPDRFFEAVGLDRLIRLLHQRQLTGWLLLCSSKFKTMFATLTPEQRAVLGKLIEPVTHRMNEHRAEVNYATAAAKQLGI